MAFLPPLATVAAAAGIAATVVQGVGAIQQGEYQNQVAKNNARIAEANAANAGKAAQIEQMRSDREYAAMLGEQVGIQSASGIDILGRTQTAVRRGTQARQGEAAIDIRRGGETNSRNLQQEAANFRAEGAQAKTQGYITGFGKFLEAGSSLAPGGKNASLIGGSRKKTPWSGK